METFYLSQEQVELEQRTFMTKVYGWMSLALAATGFTSLYVAATPSIMTALLETRFLFYGLIIGELVLVMTLSAAIARFSSQVAMLIFFAYAILNGVTFSLIFLIYTTSSIASTFFITAGTFGVMSFFGYVTKRDLTGVGHFMTMGLIGLIIASVVNIFLNNSTIYWMTTYIGIFIFVGLTAYDTQKIKAMNIIGNEGTDEDRKEAIMGALKLYLDFINLFLLLLRITGSRRS